MEVIKKKKRFLSIWCPESFTDRLDAELKKKNEKENLSMTRSAFVRKIIADYLETKN